jgi:hypothetical protein
MKDAIRILEQACERYCDWYDRGVPAMSGEDQAYELVTSCRLALAAMKEQQDAGEGK